MTDPIERELRNLLDDRARGDPLATQVLADSVASLPPRRLLTFGTGLVLAAGVVALFAVLAVAWPRFGGIGGEASPTPAPATQGTGLPGGPEAFADDPRLGQCFGAPPDIEFVFEMVHARDYQRYLPKMGRSPELEIDDPAFVVVFRDGWVGPATTGGFGTRSTPIPGFRFVCVLPGGGPPNLYGDVDITGLTLDVTPSEVTPVPADGAIPPDWALDLNGGLDCDDEPTMGYERGDGPRIGPVGTASPYEFLYATDEADLPLSGWVEEPKTAWEDGASHFVRYVNAVNGRVKALILMEGTSRQAAQGIWDVTAFHACPPGEFDASRGRTTDDAPWFDGSDAPTSVARTISGPAHCGWESTVWLFYEDRLYLRDPLGVFSNLTVRTFVDDAVLPDDARTTGLHSARWALYGTDDPDVAWMINETGQTEAWPRSSDPFIGCA